MDAPRFTDALTPAEADEVLALFDAATRPDGQEPLNEEARLLLRRPGATHWLVRDGADLAGYAQWQPDAGTGQIVVHPDHRRRGLGTALLAVLPERRVWAFGADAAASGFADASGLQPVRELLVLGRDLPADLGGRLPADVKVTGFTDADADAFIALNARAFAGHPEQGRFSASDLAARRAEAWWDADGLLLARRGERLVGFHWVKVHPDGRGEVYVIGVDPDAAGGGLGRGLLQAGLDRLAALGCPSVFLYVDGDNTRAVELYRRSGFDEVLRDVLFA